MGLVGPIAKRYFEGGGPWGNLGSPTLWYPRQDLNLRPTG